MTSNPTPPLRLDQLHRFVNDCLRATGMPDERAAYSANALATTDGMGVHTHGTKLIFGYVRKLLGGGYDATASPVIARQGPAWAVVDGRSALGMVGCGFAIELAIEKAKTCGIGYVGLINTAHVGAIGYYAAQAARQGFIAVVTANDIPSVAAPGSRAAVLGSNPIAYAVPVSGGDPILLDVATAAVAGGKVYAACGRGESIPSTWLIGPDGHPTSDGSLYPDRAWLAPMAGHKGYGIGLLCEILSAVLPGGCMTWQVGSWIFDPAEKPSGHTASFTVMHVDAMTDRQRFDDQLRRLITEIQSVPTAVGVERVLLPGEREWSNLRRAQQQGLTLPADVMDKLRQTAALVSIYPSWLNSKD